MRNIIIATSAIGVLLIALLIGYPIAYYQTSEVVTIKVTDKERIVESDGKNTTSRYLIFTENETFENTDLLFEGKFNSSDLQSKLSKGKEYKVRVYGWRVPFLSMYRNIVEIK